MRHITTEGLRRFEPVSDDAILLALDRAERHEEPNPWNETGVYWTRIGEHLGFIHNGYTTRMLRPEVERLIAAGLIYRTERTRDRIRFGLTSEGRERVMQARSSGETTLAESPVRREWRLTRENAAQLLPDVRKELKADLMAALALLDDPDAPSSAWYRLAKRLAAYAGRLGAARFFLNEWPEPDEDEPDTDRESDGNRNRREAMAAWKKGEDA